MKILRTLIIFLSIAALNACTTIAGFNERDALNEAQAVGSPFTVALTSEYRHYANLKAERFLDRADSLHFARKGLASAAGLVVMPEPLSDWDLSAGQARELSAARGRLIAAFDLSARELSPLEAAKAQAMFDCWIEQEEENRPGTYLGTCKEGYREAMDRLDSLLFQPLVPSEPSPLTGVPIDPAKPMAPENAMFLVFFDWDSATLDSSGEKVVAAIAKEILENPPEKITVTGHADTSGPHEYNERLGLRRAKAVRARLLSLGVKKPPMAVKSRGETDLLVPTPDDVREPANRRANISFQ